MIKAAIFDFDGTVADTEPRKQAKIERLRGELGLQESASEPGTVGGELPAWDVAMSLGMEYDEFVAILYSEVREEATLYPGVMELAWGCKALGLKTAIASLGYAGRVFPILEKYNLLFDYVSLVTDLEGTANAPNPKCQTVQRALTELGVQPDEVIVFEDSPSGVNGFLQAGVPAERIIVIPNQLTVSKVFPEGVIRLNSMLDAIPLDQFLASFNG
jgi:beta-phosphoglucomutase-like phosphatase (HAD superfamily)